MKKILVLILILGFWLTLGLTKILAATGTISGTNAYIWGENIGWINFLAIGSSVTVTDTGLTGYAWSSNYGWINLSPSNGGVTNNCSGILGGTAWSSTLGWINFTGAQIDSNGKFVGTIGTVGTSVGRIIFDCSNCNLETDWRPSCVITSTPTPTPIQSPTSISSTSGGWSAPICTATKPSNLPMITSVVNGDNSVTLIWTKTKDQITHYLAGYGTKSESIEFGNPNIGNSDTTSYTIKGLSGGVKYYFRIKAINDCMPGDWSKEVSSIPKGKIIKTTNIPAEGFIPISEIPSQLFDIALIVEKPKVNKASDLNAKVTFISFGREETPVEMTFTIIDENGIEYYRSVDKTSIQTEGVFNKTFKDLVLEKGKYTLILNTLYNTNVKDEFKQEIEVEEIAKVNKQITAMVGSGIILILIIWINFLIKKRVKR